MATVKKKPVAKRKPPKKPIQKKEEIEKHLKAINAALGIEETSPEAEAIAQAAEEVEVKEDTTDGAHASDLIAEPASSEVAEEPQAEATTGTEPAPQTEPVVAAPVAPTVAEPEPAPAVPPTATPGEGTIPMNSEPVPAVSATPETPEPTIVTPSADTASVPPMTDQPQTTVTPMGTDGAVPPVGDQPADFGPSEGGEGSKKKKVMIILLVILVLVALVAGGVYFYNMMASKQKATQSAAKKQSQEQFKPDPTATPTEEPLANLSEYTVQILNGSGTPGEAGKVEALLDKAGFSDITTGNADEYSYTDTEVTLKKGAPQALYDAVEKALSSNYVVVQTADELDTESDYDVQIIVGSDSPEATPAADDDE